MTSWADLELYAQHRRQPLNSELLRCLSWRCTFTAVVLVHTQFLRACEALQALLHCLYNPANSQHRCLLLPLILNAEVEREIHYRVMGRGDISTAGTCHIALEFPVE